MLFILVLVIIYVLYNYILWVHIVYYYCLLAIVVLTLFRNYSYINNYVSAGLLTYSYFILIFWSSIFLLFQFNLYYIWLQTYTIIFYICNLHIYL